MAEAEDRPAPRGSPAETPAAGPAAGAARPAQGHLRHRHARRRHEPAPSQPTARRSRGCVVVAVGLLDARFSSRSRDWRRWSSSEDGCRSWAPESPTTTPIARSCPVGRRWPRTTPICDAGCKSGRKSTTSRRRRPACCPLAGCTLSCFRYEAFGPIHIDGGAGGRHRAAPFVLKTRRRPASTLPRPRTDRRRSTARPPSEPGGPGPRRPARPGRSRSSSPRWSPAQPS